MRKFSQLTLLVIGSLFSAGLLTTHAQAQSTVLDLPRDSQHAKVIQRIGLTDITINYHRPLVKGRKVWGGLVPYGQPWRAGANENTTIEFSDAVTVEGKPLAKGIYGLHMIPGENDWIIAFSKVASAWGSFSYSQAEDALRVTVKTQPAEMHEALAYDFDDVTSNATTVTLRWEKLAVPFKVEVNNKELVVPNLQKQLRGLSQYTFEGWDDAATYLVDNKLDLEEALKYSERSIQVEDRFENEMTKARILDALNRKDDASASRTKAMGLGNVVQLHGYARGLQQQGKQEEAFEIFRMNIKKNPNHWMVHTEVARIAVANGDFDTAIKEMKLGLAGAPAAPQKTFLEALIKRLEAKDDINK